jgi:glycosyltransferase involved in cell wall biosynthesis
MDILSVIVGYRNRDLKRVHYFLNSLNNQTFKNFELIFVDSGTEYELSKKIETLVKQYSFCKYLYDDSRGKDFNRSLVLNIGARHASGNYLYFTDIDLIFHPKYLQHLYSIKNEHHHVYSRVYLVSQSYKAYDNIVDSDIILFSELSHPSGKGLLMLPKTAFEAIGGYDEYYTDWGVEDNDIYRRLCEQGLTEQWTEHEKYPVYHQWHPSNERFHEFPEKWLDDISFYYIVNQKNIKRNVNYGQLFKTENRKLLVVIENQIDIPAIELPSTGFNSTKTLYYRTIWQFLNSPDNKYFKVIVPKYKVPKMSYPQTILAQFFCVVLKVCNSPFSLIYFQKKERYHYFLPEEDIKWFFRKLVKETHLIKDFYILTNEDKTIYYIENY